MLFKLAASLQKSLIRKYICGAYRLRDAQDNFDGFFYYFLTMLWTYTHVEPVSTIGLYGRSYFDFVFNVTWIHGCCFEF